MAFSHFVFFLLFYFFFSQRCSTWTLRSMETIGRNLNGSEGISRSQLVLLVLAQYASKFPVYNLFALSFASEVRIQELTSSIGAFRQEVPVSSHLHRRSIRHLTLTLCTVTALFSALCAFVGIRCIVRTSTFYTIKWWCMYPTYLEAGECWPGLLECNGIPHLVSLVFPPVVFSMQLLDWAHHPYISTGFGRKPFRSPCSYINHHIWSLGEAFQAACYTKCMWGMHIDS